MKIKKYQPTLSLKPTQFSVGVVETEYKVDQMRKLKKVKLQKLIDDTPIPVVLSPWGELCVIDHHHFLFSCWHLNVKKVRVKVHQDLSKSKMTYVQFWRYMAKKGYAYLIDQFGDGPRSPLYLPSDVRGMADDPYRSLAWIVRKEGGYEKVDSTFCEFKWANFFRRHHLLNAQGKHGLKKMVAPAIELAKSTKASRMPGYINVKKSKKVVQKALEESGYIKKDQKKGILATQAQITQK